MNVKQNPYAAPRQFDPVRRGPFIPHCLLNRLRFAGAGAGIGMLCGIFWTVVFGPATGDPYTDLRDVLSSGFDISGCGYTAGFSLTGFVVGLIRRLPALTGPFFGTTILGVWALMVGPRDGWMMLWLIVYGGSGFSWGFMIGSFFWLATRRMTGKQIRADFDRR